MKMVSKLTESQLIEFAKLNKKAKSKRVTVKMTSEEYDKLKELSALHGVPVSQQLRRSFFAQNHQYFFQGISHKVSK